MNSHLLLSAFSGATSGPKLLGVDIVWAATMLAAVGVLAVLIAVYGTLTVRDPMAKRVKALNDRSEQLKEARKSGVSGKSVSVRVDLGGRCRSKKKKQDK